MTSQIQIQSQSQSQSKIQLDEELTHSIIGAAIEVHRHLRPGLFESIYERAMIVELGVRGIPFRSQVAIPTTYKGEPVGDYLRVGLLINFNAHTLVKGVKRVIR